MALITLAIVIGGAVATITAERYIQAANEDRCLNRKFATEAYVEIVENYELSIRTYEFAIEGLKEHNPDDHATIDRIEQLLFDIYAARAFLEKDYRQYMKDNEPIRSVIPPFRKECR